MIGSVVGMGEFLCSEVFLILCEELLFLFSELDLAVVHEAFILVLLFILCVV